jgi:glutamate racemase
MKRVLLVVVACVAASAAVLLVTDSPVTWPVVGAVAVIAAISVGTPRGVR